MVKLAFVCVENAGRSQMAMAYAEKEVKERGLGDAVEVVMGGTEPADAVHDVVVDVMLEDGVDVHDRVPREIRRDDVMEADVVVTMGCSAEGVCPATWSGYVIDWGLPDPADASTEEARKIRDEVKQRVVELFDELEWDRGT